MTVKSGKDVKAYSNAGGEDELVVPRGTKFLIDVEKSGIQKLEIFDEEAGGIELRDVEVVYMTEI